MMAGDDDEAKREGGGAHKGEELQELLVKWQKRLRLQDWDVKVFYKRHWDLPEAVDGQCRVVPTLKRAYIYVIDPEHHEPSSEEIDQHSEELILIHELLHIYFDPWMRDETNKDRITMMEVAIQKIAEALTREE